MSYGSNLNRNMQEIKDDMLVRTHQMKSWCLDTETIGIQTIIQLSDQNEQLVNMNSCLSSTDSTLIDTKQNINRLKGVTQRVMDTFRIKFNRKIISKILTNSTKPQTSSATARRRESSPKIIQHDHIPSTNCFIDRQIDETLYDIEKVIHRLKYLAQDINDQLVGQANTLDHIQEHVITSTDQIEEQNRDFKKIV